MAKKKTNRTRLEQYFRYSTMIHRPWWDWMLSLIQAIIVFASLYLQFHGKPFPGPAEFALEVMKALFLAGLVFAATSFVKFFLLQLHKALARSSRANRLSALENQTQAILRHDYKRALKAIVRESGLKPTDLQAIGTAYHDELENRLFEGDELRRYLGLMTDQSLRMTTPYGPDPDFAATTNDRLTGHGLFQAYFLPIRLTCLFFTDDEIVIGDAVFDSRSGDLQSRIERLARRGLKGLSTRTAITTQIVSPQRLLSWLSDHRFTAREEKKIGQALHRYNRQCRASKKRGHPQPDPPYVLQRETKYLKLERNGAKPRYLPMSMTHQLVRAAQTKSGAATPLAPLKPTEALTRSAPEKKRRSVTPASTSHLEYRTRWSLIADLTIAALICTASYLLTGVFSVDHSKALTSTQMSSVMVERNGEDTPQHSDHQHLPAALKDKAWQDENWGFSCARVLTVMKQTPNWRSETLSNVKAGQAVILRENQRESGAPMPPGWVEIQMEKDGALLSGFGAGEYFDAQNVTGPMVCR